MSEMVSSPYALYKREWMFNKEDHSSPPHFGVCFSGGGNRSAAFAIGVLRALHELGLLCKVDVISAVSGGSYALSWFLLQPFYHSACVSDPKAAIGRIQGEMFDVRGLFQQHLEKNAKPLCAIDWSDILFGGVLDLLFDVFLSIPLRLLSILSVPYFKTNPEYAAAKLNNTNEIRSEYIMGILQTYQVFPDSEKKARTSNPSPGEEVFGGHAVTGIHWREVSPVTFPVLGAFAHRAGLPSFVFNATVVPPRPGDDVPLRKRIFELGSMGFGSDSCGYLTWEDTAGLGWDFGETVGKDWFMKKLRFKNPDLTLLGKKLMGSPYATIRNFNLAPGISGAALSGTNLKGWKGRCLLRLLNLGLEYAVPSPADRKRVVRLSDGGHSENLGAYALLRRRCRTILIVDAEHDPSYEFGAYRNLKEAADQDEHLGISINVPDIENILNGINTFSADKPVMEGTTTIDGESYGRIHYMKLSKHDGLLGDQEEIVKLYAEKHEAFPQESTVDQYFEEPQFKAYRALGYAIARTLRPDMSERGHK